MANEEHLQKLKAGVLSWNRWRAKNPSLRPDLSGADLTGADLARANLTRTSLAGAILRGANFKEADLKGADLKGADLTGVDLTGANFRIEDLTPAVLLVKARVPGLGNLVFASTHKGGKVWIATPGSRLELTLAEDASVPSITEILEALNTIHREIHAVDLEKPRIRIGLFEVPESAQAGLRK
jgi:hypothetical protein